MFVAMFNFAYEMSQFNRLTNLLFPSAEVEQCSNFISFIGILAPTVYLLISLHCLLVAIF